MPQIFRVFMGETMKKEAYRIKEEKMKAMMLVNDLIVYGHIEEEVYDQLNCLVRCNESMI